MPPNQLTIDLSAIAHNYKLLQQCVGSNVKLMGVIKSDAYGHGMIPVARVLEKSGCQNFAVFHVLEGILLRKSDFHQPVLILMGIHPENAEEAVAFDLTSVVYHKNTAECLSQEACKQGKIAKIQIKVDSGMNRLGVYPKDLNSFMTSIQNLPGLKVNGFISHFAVSDQPDQIYTQKQIQSFQNAIINYTSDGMIDHIANSGGIIDHKGLNFPLARTGIALYGSSPDPDWSKAHLLKPAMSFQSKIIYVKNVPADQSISYGRTYRTKSNTRVATIPVGYANGYQRKLSNKAHVLIHGKRVPVIGRICMNLTMINITDIPNVCCGDSVVLLGQQNNKQITADELALHADTISYEIMCNLGSANSRIYIN
ncbi:Alanine racemase region domain protein [Candidatus Magnetomorum sp. HK-1]|nr:Alanine racemase region domain protein [Candidatus Magnetomorum sp. HK-1]